MADLNVYGFGYSGRELEDLKKECVRLNAIAVDTRLKPFSKAHGWNRFQLEGYFSKQYYEWVPAFGNLNYKGEFGPRGQIMLQNPDRGLARMGQIYAEGRPVILLCTCKDAGKCHRRVAAQLISEMTGGQYIELKPTRRQIDMFSL